MGAGQSVSRPRPRHQLASTVIDRSVNKVAPKAGDGDGGLSGVNEAPVKSWIGSSECVFL